MAFYFAWVDRDTDFDPVVHNREDEQIFSLSISQKEGEFAQADVMIQYGNTFFQSLDHAWCLISYEDALGDVHCLFRGRLLEAPKKLEPPRITLRFTAELFDACERLDVLRSEHQESDAFDPLFLSEEERKDPETMLLARTDSLYWDRVTGEVRFSNLFRGHEHVDLGRGDVHSLAIGRTKESPLDAVEVTLQAQLVQRLNGYTNLFPLIASLFKEGVVNTLTGETFKKIWPRRGQRLKRSGYWIVDSELEEFTPSNSNARFSPSIVQQDPTGKKYDVRFKRSWFNGSLLLGWRYRQKRVENVTFTLEHHFQNARVDRSLQRKKTFSLNFKVSVPTYHFPCGILNRSIEMEKGFVLME